MIGTGSEQIGLIIAKYLWLFILLAIWDLCWRSVALWKSARHGQLPWFIALMIVNSIGILPIIYIAFFQKKKKR